MERFWRYFLYNFDIFPYYSEYRVGKDLGKDLEVVLIDVGRFVEGFWIDFGKVLDVLLLNYL